MLNSVFIGNPLSPVTTYGYETKLKNNLNVLSQLANDRSLKVYVVDGRLEIDDRYLQIVLRKNENASVESYKVIIHTWTHVVSMEDCNKLSWAKLVENAYLGTLVFHQTYHKDIPTLNGTMRDIQKKLKASWAADLDVNFKYLHLDRSIGEQPEQLSDADFELM